MSAVIPKGLDALNPNKTLNNLASATRLDFSSRVKSVKINKAIQAVSMMYHGDDKTHELWHSQYHTTEDIRSSCFGAFYCIIKYSYAPLYYALWLWERMVQPRPNLLSLA